MKTNKDIVEIIDKDLQLETDFRLSRRQKLMLELNGEVTISHACFKLFADRAHQYLSLCNEDDRNWGCVQDLATLDYTIKVIRH